MSKNIYTQIDIKIWIISFQKDIQNPIIISLIIENCLYKIARIQPRGTNNATLPKICLYIPCICSHKISLYRFEGNCSAKDCGIFKKYSWKNTNGFNSNRRISPLSEKGRDIPRKKERKVNNNQYIDA